MLSKVGSALSRILFYPKITLNRCRCIKISYESHRFSRKTVERLPNLIPKAKLKETEGG